MSEIFGGGTGKRYPARIHGSKRDSTGPVGIGHVRWEEKDPMGSEEDILKLVEKQFLLKLERLRKNCRKQGGGKGTFLPGN